MKLAMKLNGLLASPAFASWLVGERIDIASMLRTADGRPRCAVVSIAHLSDEQRQSVVSVVLAKLISWMRRQSGTSDLRTLLYMDEVAGYLPPVGNPPTKPPIMLLLKQARAFGVGVVLSTQNPVDVDYKALSNAGTWMIGRLQTEQDKARLVDGLTSAAGSVDPRAVGDTISGLGKREFVMKRASKDTVSVFTTRWAMSYLRGPLTREQIASLRAGSSGSAGARCPGTGHGRRPRAVPPWPEAPAAPPPRPPAPPTPPLASPAPGAPASPPAPAPRPRQPRRPAPWRLTRPRSSRRRPRASPCTSSTPPPRGRHPWGRSRAIGSPRAPSPASCCASTTPGPGSSSTRSTRRSWPRCRRSPPRPSSGRSTTTTATCCPPRHPGRSTGSPRPRWAPRPGGPRSSATSPTTSSAP